MIVAENIRKTYGSFTAVEDVSFTVDTGDIVGLLGPNGAGKTTILKILTCYHFPTSGKARLNSFDVCEQPGAVKRIVGYLPENVPLYHDLNVYEYLEFIAGSRGITGKAGRREIERVLGECGLDQVVYRQIYHLSKGYRQRVGLAQAIIHNPDVLVLDEPTNGLDPNQILEIRDLIRRLGKEKTVILSTHILQEVEAVCTRILILHRGRLVACDTTENLERSMKGETVFKLLLKGKPLPGLRESLRKLGPLRKVMKLESKALETSDVYISLIPSSDAGEQIFDWAVAEGLKILAMNQEHLSLEDIFVELTRSGGGRNA